LPPTMLNFFWLDDYYLFCSGGFVGYANTSNRLSYTHFSPKKVGGERLQLWLQLPFQSTPKRKLVNT